jgi:ABC-type multidrug transport system fused ATPase/permease subunit
LLRLQELNSGELLVNGTDISRYDPDDFHTRLTAVMQGFARFHTSVKENVGVGYINDLGSRTAVERAIDLASADAVVEKLPHGLNTKLDSFSGAYDPIPYPIIPGAPVSPADDLRVHHGLSGGEWQRIAISRAFMRAHRPEVDLLVFDEPVSASFATTACRSDRLTLLRTHRPLLWTQSPRTVFSTLLTGSHALRRARSAKL